MSEGGVYVIARSLWDDPDFADEPYTEKQAMAWLIGAAAWKATTVRLNGPIKLERGEFCFSTRFLAEKWQWSKSRVHRFLQRRVDLGTLRGIKRDGAKIYYLLNYNRLQFEGRAERDTKGDKSGTGAGQERDKEEEGNKVRKKEKNNSTPRSELMRVLDEEHAVAVIEHRQRLGKALTPYAAKLLANKLSLCRDPNAAAEEMIANGWQGFDPAWIEGRAPQGQSPPRQHPLAEAMDRISERRRNHNEPTRQDPNIVDLEEGRDFSVRTRA